MNTAIIFSGWNQRAVIAFCRFCKSRRVSYYIIAKDEKDSILISDYKDKVFQIRQDLELSVEYLKKLYYNLSCVEGKKPVVIPTTEYLNRFFLSNRAELESIGYIIPLCENHLYDIISNKEEFEKLCKSRNISTPNVLSNISEKNIPFVIKPKKYFFGNNHVAEKPKLIMNKDEFYKLGELSSEGYYYQEFICGDSFYLLYYFAKDGSYSLYSQKNFAQQHCGLSIIAAESSTMHEDLRSSAYTNMFKDIGYHGLVMIEVRDFKEDLYMIEANPRLWGPSQLILDSGMDLFEQFAFDWNLICDKNEYTYKPQIKYFWLGGLYETSSLKKESVCHSGYNTNLLVKEFASWLNADIYMRKDTIQVFFSEIQEKR